MKSVAKISLIAIPIILILAISLSFTKIEMFQIPYYTEIWGTVSDWIMIVVTGVTAYYLYHTLESQNSALDLERRKYKEAKQPIFSCKFLNYNSDIVRIWVECRSRMAKKVRITYQNKPQLYHFIPRHGEVLYVSLVVGVITYHINKMAQR